MSTPGKKKTVLFVVTGNAVNRVVDRADVSKLVFFPTAGFFLSPIWGEGGTKPLVLDTHTTLVLQLLLIHGTKTIALKQNYSLAQT